MLLFLLLEYLFLMHTNTHTTYLLALLLIYVLICLSPNHQPPIYKNTKKINYKLLKPIEEQAVEEIIEDEEQVNNEHLCVFVVMNALMGCILFG